MERIELAFTNILKNYCYGSLNGDKDHRLYVSVYKKNGYNHQVRFYDVNKDLAVTNITFNIGRILGKKVNSKTGVIRFQSSGLPIQAVLKQQVSLEVFYNLLCDDDRKAVEQRLKELGKNISDLIDIGLID